MSAVRIEVTNYPENHSRAFGPGDTVEGIATLNLKSQSKIKCIRVKLQGLCRTNFRAKDIAIDGQPRTREFVETNKLVNITQQVFPPKKGSLKKLGVYTLAAGEYTYNFSLTFPTSYETFQSGVGSKETLPPSCEDSVRSFVHYCVKATVDRPNLLTSNLRSEIPIAFLPNEPPLAHGDKIAMSTSTKQVDEDLLSQIYHWRHGAHGISMEIRLPHKGELLRAKRLPLRIKLHVEDVNDFPDLRLFGIEIHITAMTSVFAINQGMQAHDEFENDDFLVYQKTGIGLQLLGDSQPGRPANSSVPHHVSRLIEVPSSIWKEARIDESFTPTFHTSSIHRNYKLSVVLGLRPKAHDPTIRRIRAETEIVIRSGINIPPKSGSSSQSASTFGEDSGVDDRGAKAEYRRRSSAGLSPTAVPVPSYGS